MPIKDLCRNGNLSGATLRKWRSKLGCINLSDAQRLKALEPDNNTLKRKLLANSMLEIDAIREVLKQKWRPSATALDSYRPAA